MNGGIEAKKLAKIETRLFINGQFKDSSNGETFDVVNPATQEVVAKVAEATVADTNEAVAAAKAAFPAWSKLSPEERGKPMIKMAELITKFAGELAYLEAISMGKPVATFFDWHYAAQKFKSMSTLGWLAQGKSSLNTPGIVGVTFRQPYGVTAAIIPWNAPLIFLAWKCASALAVGNTAVLKSSEKAPLTVSSTSFPAMAHPAVPLSPIIWTSAVSLSQGSERTGRAITAAAAQSNLKNVLLELDGKSPLVVFDDCDLDKAAADAQFSIQVGSGQGCIASSRVYVQETIAEAFIERYTKLLSMAKMGDPLDPTTSHGPQADHIQYNTVHKYIEIGKNAGGKLIMGGTKREGKGYFVSPTVFTGSPENAQHMKEEIFATVANINIFKTGEEVLEKANNTEFGLYASVYTKNIDRAMRFGKGMEAGTVGVNVTSPTSLYDLPFGGFKASGVGREGLMESVESYLEVKTALFKFDS